MFTFNFLLIVTSIIKLKNYNLKMIKTEKIYIIVIRMTTATKYLNIFIAGTLLSRTFFYEFHFFK